MRYTFVDTLHEIEARVAQRPPMSGDGGVKTASMEMRKLAEDIRKLGESAQDLTYEELYAVQSGTFAVPDSPSAPDSKGAGDPLRKLAHDLRVLDRAEALTKVARANDILAATRALTLLRERLGSTT